MTRDQIYAATRATLGWPSPDKCPDWKLEPCIERATLEVSRRLEPLWRDYEVYLDATAQEYPLNPAWERVEWVSWNGRRLEKSDLDQWRSRNKVWEAGDKLAPEEYALYSDRLILWPAPGGEAIASCPKIIVRAVVTPATPMPAAGPEGLLPSDHWLIVNAAAAAYWMTQPEMLAVAAAHHESFEREAALVAKRYAARRVLP